MLIFSTLIGLSVVAFVLAYLLRNRNFPQSIYDGILCFGGAVILGVTLFDFVPHLYADFPFFGGHEHHDHHGHHHDEQWNWLKSSVFGLILIGGFISQILLEKFLGKKNKHEFQHVFLVIGLFLHSFSETVILHDEFDNINKALFTGILLHKLPISFILAYTLISTTTLKNSLFGFGFFLLAIPLGLASNSFMVDNPTILNLISVFVAGMLLHVVWHLLESLKSKNVRNLVVLIAGLGFGYAITLFHMH